MKYLILIFIFTAVSGTTSAEEHAPTKSYSKTQKVDFESTEVEGLVRSPDGAFLTQKKGLKFMPLYKVEKKFDNDIKQSVEYLR